MKESLEGLFENAFGFMETNRGLSAINEIYDRVDKLTKALEYYAKQYDTTDCDDSLIARTALEYAGVPMIEHKPTLHELLLKHGIGHKPAKITGCRNLYHIESGETLGDYTAKQAWAYVHQLEGGADCNTCKGDAWVCAELPCQGHCEKATRNE